MFGQPKTVYIDPDYIGVKKGTIEQPFNSWKDVLWKDGLTCLFKAGSTIKVNYHFFPSGNKITIGSYGTGDKPHIISSVPSGQKVFDLAHLTDVTIQDLEIESTNYATACICLMYAVRGKVINCKVHGAEWGIRNLNSTGMFRIINSEIYHIGDDGCFIGNLDSVELSGSNIYDINLKYYLNPDEAFSGGDVFQMGNVKYFYVHDNTLDHGVTGNKFCIIVNGDGIITSRGIIERNHLLRQGGILVYLDHADGVILRYNKLENSEIAIYDHSSNAQIYNNVFNNITGNVLMLGTPAGSVTKFYNNTFYNINTLSNTYRCEVLFRNNIFSNCYGTLFVHGTNPNADYNCYYKVNNFGSFNIGIHSIKSDPMFNDASKFDFRLKSGSPCIGSGIHLINSDKEIRDNLVSNDVPADIGAGEFPPDK